MEKNKNADLWFKILDTALLLPGSKINRESFLQKEFGKYCGSETLERILKEGSVNAQIELSLMDKIADDVIKFHSVTAASISFAAGIPGGLVMAATIPGDIAQFYYQIIVVAQKLAYIYGILSMEDYGEEFKSLLTVFIGVMAGIDEANKAMNEVMEAQFSKKIKEIVIGKTLDKSVLRIAVRIGLQLTNKNIFKAVAKFLPLVSGIVSGGLTLFSFLPMCSNLKNRFHNSIENRFNSISKA
jgi:hypothetical protein